MTRGVSIAHAKRIARRAPAACLTSARVDEQGRLQTEIPIDVREARLRPGRSQDVRVVLYECGSVGEGGNPQPIPTKSGGQAFASPSACAHGTSRAP